MDNQYDELMSLSYEKLFQIAEEKFNEFLYDEAQMYYEAAYHKKPHEEMIVLCYSHVLKLNEKQDQARQILIKSLQKNPNGSYKRYFQLAELYDEEQSIELFLKGIKGAQKSLDNPFLTVTTPQQIKRDIAQAAASIAGIYLHDMTIDFKQVKSQCWQILKKGQQIDPNCMDLRLQFANYYYEIDKEEEAINQLQLFRKNILAQKEDYDDELVIQCAKQLIELGCSKQSLQILEKIHENQSDNPQIIYFMAGCNFNLENFQDCKQLLQMYPIKGSGDREIDEGVQLLRKKIASKSNKQIDETEEGMQEDDDWEDIDDENDE